MSAAKFISVNLISFRATNVNPMGALEEKSGKQQILGDSSFGIMNLCTNLCGIPMTTSVYMGKL